ncbi:MAG TPA: (2Fe-2S) ferredoxin domain-containing protein [Clostridia bacterium]|nr:(2Fe-2S) ferredoxin domain-containing protein [Clostridia bacterium]
MKVTVCVGSSCHLTGSKAVVEALQRMAEEKGVSEKVELCGSFCMGNCTGGVCIKLGETIYSLCLENIDAFFEKEIMMRL